MRQYLDLSLGGWDNVDGGAGSVDRKRNIVKVVTQNIEMILAHSKNAKAVLECGFDILYHILALRIVKLYHIWQFITHRG